MSNKTTKNEYYIVLVNGRFVGDDLLHTFAEYPEAKIFYSFPEARRCAECQSQFKHSPSNPSQIEVVADYGLDTARIVWSSAIEREVKAAKLI